MAIIHSIKKRFYDATGKTLVERQDEIPSLSNNWNNVKSFLDNNLVEVRFKRRIYPAVGGKGYRKTRHMLCTSNFFYAKSLSIAMGKPIKKVKIKRPKSFYRSRKLILVYCITQSDYRMINLDPPNFEVIDYIPFRTENLQTIGKMMRVYNMKNLPEGTKKRFHNS